MRLRAVLTVAALAGAMGLNASRAVAQGFSVYEHDVCTMGRAGVGVANPCSGGSAVFFNPAGIVTGSGAWNASAGVVMIPPRGSFTPDGGTEVDLVANNIPVPDLYLTRQIGSRWAVGVGMFAPYGLTTEWDPTSPGRFLSYKATIKGIYIQPTVAFRVSPRIQIGAGFDVVRASVDLRQHVDLSVQTLPGTSIPFSAIGIPAGTDFADARLHGSATAYAAHFGIIVRPTDAISLGARYLTGTTIDGEGYAGFTQIATGIRLPAGNPLGLPAGTPLDAVLAGQFATGGRMVTQTVAASIAFPSQLVFGFDWRAMERLHVMADVQLTNWSAFDILPMELGVIGLDTLYEDYSNTTGFRAAVEYALTPKLNLRGGFLMHGAAAPDYGVTPLLPEAARKEFVIGAGYQLSSGIRVDAAVQLINQEDRRGRIIDWKPGDADPNSGVYAFSAKLFGLGFTFNF